MKTKFALAAMAWLTITGAAYANDFTIDAGVLPTAPSAPYAHLFVHDARAFTDTIDFIVPGGSIQTSANPLNLKLGPLDVFNIQGLTYSVWGGTAAAPTTWYGDFPGTNITYDIGLSVPGAYHLLVSGVSNGIAGGTYGVALVSGVPEPETISMLLAGMGVMGMVARRKKRGAKSEAALEESAES